MQAQWAIWPINFVRTLTEANLDVEMRYLFVITIEFRYNNPIRLNDFNNLETWNARYAC